MTLRIAGTLVWFAAAALAVGFGVIDADGPSAPTAATHPRAVITTVETIRVGVGRKRQHSKGDRK